MNHPHEETKDEVKAQHYRKEGNKRFATEEYNEALEYYNASLCFAPAKSPSIALAYGNRSAVYEKVGEYMKALQNIRLARDADYPKTTIVKLNQRETRCVGARNLHPQPTKDPWDFFKLSYEPHQNYPAVAECLDIQTTEEYGRRIVANRDLKPGDVIVVEKLPFKAVTGHNFFTRCANCLKSNKMSLIPHPTCAYAMFCSKDCMDEGNELCAKDGDYNLVIRMTRDALATFDGDLQQMKAYIESAEDIQTALEVDLSTPAAENYARNKLLAFRSLTTGLIQWSYLKFHPILSQFQVPADRRIVERFMHFLALRLCTEPKYEFKILSDIRDQSVVEGSKRGAKNIHYDSFVSLVAPFFVHSCLPNAREVIFDNKLAVVVLLPIKAREKISISYGPLFTADHSERQKYLLDNFKFRCACIVCENGLDFTDFHLVDEQFKAPKVELKTAEKAIEDYKLYSSRIEKHFKNFPSYEVTCLAMASMTCLDHIAKCDRFYSSVTLQQVSQCVNDVINKENPLPLQP